MEAPCDDRRRCSSKRLDSVLDAGLVEKKVILFFSPAREVDPFSC